MFKKSSAQPDPAPRPERQEQSFLQSGVRLEGELEVAGDLRIEGSAKGVINVRGVLMIGPKASVEGDLKGREVVIHGRVGGTLRAVERIHLAKGAKVKGDLYCRSLVIDEGVHFEGHSHMDAGMEKKADVAEAAAGLPGAVTPESARLRTGTFPSSSPQPAGAGVQGSPAGKTAKGGRQ
jgi:cytoskeletal protein CcmA (bactofilin family)